MTRRSACSLLLAPAIRAATESRICVIAHRGEHKRHPENTLPAFAEAIRLGVDYIEVDVRTTADARLVVMHDATVDRCTNGSGAVRAMTFPQIRALDAGAKFDARFAGTRAPSFDEVLDLARGKIGVYVDAKEVSAPALVAALEQHGAAGRCVIYGSVALLGQLRELRPSLRIMPEAGDTDHLRMLLRTLSPSVIAFDARDFRDDVIAIAREARVDIFVDRLGPADQREAWEDAIRRGATGIQTDRPGDLTAYLRRRAPVQL